MNRVYTISNREDDYQHSLPQKNDTDFVCRCSTYKLKFIRTSSLKADLIEFPMAIIMTLLFSTQNNIVNIKSNRSITFPLTFRVVNFYGEKNCDVVESLDLTCSDGSKCKFSFVLSRTNFVVRRRNGLRSNCR